MVRLVETAGNPRVLVVGDLMLDRYVWGETRRISGEGPIPILEVMTEESRPGGAGNVVSDLAHLGAQVTVCGVIGAEDKEGDLIVRELKKLNARCDGVLTAPDRPTTVKTRFIGYVQSAHRGVQQMLRVDRESRQPITRETEEKLLAFIEVGPAAAAMRRADRLRQGAADRPPPEVHDRAGPASAASRSSPIRSSRGRTRSIAAARS